MSGYIRQRSEGSWTLQWYLGTGANGKRQYGSKTIRGTKREAQAELRRILHEVETGQYAKPTKLTVADFLRRWLRDYASTSVTGTTFERYEGIVEQHLIPALGGIELSKLQPIQVQEYYRKAQESGGAGGGRLSSTTVHQHHAVLHKALRCAVRWRLLTVNVCDAVDSPRVVSKERPAFTQDEIQTLVKFADGTPNGPLVLLAASTGARLGELLALTWGDLDGDRGCIKITKSLEQTRSGLKVKEPKSAKGRRNIPLPENVVRRLLLYREQQEAQAEAAGELWQENGLICCDGIGGYRRPCTVSSAFRELAKRAGVRTMGIHALRHAHASLLANRGWSPKIIQERLGHSTIAVTMDIYSHVLPTTQQEAADSLNDVF